MLRGCKRHTAEPRNYNRPVLEIALRNVSFLYRNGVKAVQDVDLTVPKHAHVAVVGPPGCGASTLLRLIGGDLRPSRGEVRIGTRVVNAVRRSQRPLLYTTADPDAPGRWSVRHLLVAAVRRRSLDRVDRRRELDAAITRWALELLLDRSLDALSSTERAMANLARIELLRPAVLVADRVLECVNPSAVNRLADDFYRTLRVAGTTVIAAPSSPVELGMMDSLVVLDRGRVVQEGVPSHVFRSPESEAAATATGEVNVVPVTIAAGVVESVIGSWSVERPPFEGSGIALARPDDFIVAGSGEESDIILAVEEASFHDGAWHVRGVLSGDVVLRVALPQGTAVHKGKLLALRYDPSRFRLLRAPARTLAPTVPTDVVPPMRETR